MFVLKKKLKHNKKTILTTVQSLEYFSLCPYTVDDRMLAGITLHTILPHAV